MMNDWIKMLSMEIQMVDKIEKSNTDIPTEEYKPELLGPAPEEIMKLYTLYVHAVKAKDRILAELKWDPENEDLKQKVDEYGTKANALSSILAVSLKEKFGWGKHLSLSKDGNIYSIVFQSTQLMGPEDFFRRMFGDDRSLGDLTT